MPPKNERVPSKRGEEAVGSSLATSGWDEMFRPVKDEVHHLSFGEEEAAWLFDEEHVVTVEELDAKIKEIFHNVCGEYGRQEFFEIVVPKVKQIYGTNLRKAGLRLLEEIDQGANQKPSEIASYFRDAISPSELEFIKRPKEEVRREVYAGIEEVIRKERERFGDIYPVEGAFIYGSFPKNNFSSRSDIDLIWFVNGKELGAYLKEEELYIDLMERLKKLTEDKTGFEVQTNMLVSHVNVSDKDELGKFAEIIKEQFVAENTPYALIGLEAGKKKELEDLIGKS